MPKGKGDKDNKTPKNTNKKYNLREKKSKKKRYNKNSDTSGSETDDSEWINEEDDYDTNSKDIQKMIAKMFPTHTEKDKKRQLKAIDKMKKKEKREKMDKKKKTRKEKEEQRSNKTSSKNRNKKILPKKNKRHKNEEYEEDKEYYDEEDEEEEDEYQYSEEDEEEVYDDIDCSDYDMYEDYMDEDAINELKENMKFNIIFTIGDKNGEGLMDEELYYDKYLKQYDDEEMSEELSDVYKDTCEEEEEEEEEEEDEEDEEDEEEEEEAVNKKIKAKKPTKNNKKPNKSEDVDINEPVLLSDKNATKKIKNKGKNKDKAKIKDKNISFKVGDKVEVKLNDWNEYYPGKITKVKPSKKRKKNPYNLYDIELDDKTLEIIRSVKYNGSNIRKIRTEEEDLIEYAAIIEELQDYVKTKKNKGTKAFQKKIDKMMKYTSEKQQKIDETNSKKKKLKNIKKFRKLLSDNNVMNDYKYFKSLDSDNQSKIIRKLREVKKFTKIEKPYRITLLESEIPVEFKSAALKKIDTLEFMDPGSGEYYKIKHWIDGFMQIPFNKYNNLPVKIGDGTELCNKFMEDSKRILDECVYGLDDAKMQILQMIGQWISNPDSIGTAIAIKGPPGTGKTTLVKEGISKILNRPFAFLALGGATDSSFLEGHSYTYEGSNWGKIVDIVMNCKSMNPVIYFDELDKISDTPKGEEITGILTHLTDTTQNSEFHDKYFSSIDFNLSKCMFIFSYNVEEKVNPILKDRMYRIETKGYDKKEKTIIAQKYLIPKIEKNINFKKEDIIINDEIIEHICEKYTDKEKGVRNLKRALEIIYTKLNLYRLMKEGSSLFGKEETIKVSFPFTVTKEIVDKLIKYEKENRIPFGMYL
jgi:ATP-dependent Lon protease